jgi:integrase
MRVGNIQEMRWNEVSFSLGTWLIPDPKNGEPHTVSLSKAALEVLQERHDNRENLSPYVFPGGNLQNGGITPDKPIREYKKAWAVIVKQAGIENLRVHDIRRTMGSYLAMDGNSSGLIMETLGHKSSHMVLVYQKIHNAAAKLATDKVIDKMHLMASDIKSDAVG